jgi:hypothetical protein
VLKYAKAPALWLAIGLVLGSGALSFAATGNGHGQGPKPKPSVSATADENENESADDQDEQSEDKGAQEENANRKQNHGFFVSQAAHCEDVNDTENSVEFTAPDDCDSNGKAHGGYVSDVARSDAGKGPHGNGSEGS